jgi:hypothetical protein
MHCRLASASVAAILVLATACGASPPSRPAQTTTATAALPSATASPTPVGFATMMIIDAVQNAATTRCPRGTPAAAECFTLVESGSSPQLGAVTVAPVLDIEYPPDQPQCGAQHAFLEQLLVTGGTLIVRVLGPFLCLGATGATQRTFSVQSGSGTFKGSTGSGTIEFDTLSNGASEAWAGVVDSPGR